MLLSVKKPAQKVKFDIKIQMHQKNNASAKTYKSYLQKGVLNEYLNYRNRFTYTGNFVFYGLTPSTEYEVIIQSRNKEGWSDASDIFRFSTRDRGDYLYILA